MMNEELSSLLEECERTIRYLREIGAKSRVASTLLSDGYADFIADSLECAVTEYKVKT